MLVAGLGAGEVAVIYLRASQDRIAARLAARQGHYFKVSLIFKRNHDRHVKLRQSYCRANLML